MKNTIIIILVAAIVIMAASIKGKGTPYLVCDAVTDATHYEVTIDGETETVPAFDLGDGTVMLRYDLAGIETGPFKVAVKAINIWGMSAATTKDFTKALPVAPANVRIEE